MKHENSSQFNDLSSEMPEGQDESMLEEDATDYEAIERERQRAKMELNL